MDENIALMIDTGKSCPWYNDMKKYKASERNHLKTQLTNLQRCLAGF